MSAVAPLGRSGGQKGSGDPKAARPISIALDPAARRHSRAPAWVDSPLWPRPRRREGKRRASVEQSSALARVRDAPNRRAADGPMAPHSATTGGRSDRRRAQAGSTDRDLGPRRPESPWAQVDSLDSDRSSPATTAGAAGVLIRRAVDTERTSPRPRRAGARRPGQRLRRPDGAATRSDPRPGARGAAPARPPGGPSADPRHHVGRLGLDLDRLDVAPAVGRHPDRDRALIARQGHSGH